MNWTKVLIKSVNKQQARVKPNMIAYGMKSDDHTKDHVLMVIPKGKELDVERLKGQFKSIPMVVVKGVDAVGTLTEPLIVLTTVSDVNTLDLPGLRMEKGSGYVPMGRDRLKAHGNGTLWVITAGMPKNIDDLDYLFTVVRVPAKEGPWLDE